MHVANENIANFMTLEINVELKFPPKLCCCTYKYRQFMQNKWLIGGTMRPICQSMFK